MANVYLDRANSFTLVLTQDGVAPTANAITRVDLWIPGSAFNTGLPVIVNTDGPYATLTDNATSVKVSLGELEIKQGAHNCYISVYDAVNITGFAWDTFIIRVLDWPKEL